MASRRSRRKAGAYSSQNHETEQAQTATMSRFARFSLPPASRNQPQPTRSSRINPFPSQFRRFWPQFSIGKELVTISPQTNGFSPGSRDRFLLFRIFRPGWGYGPLLPQTQSEGSLDVQTATATYCDGVSTMCRDDYHARLKQVLPFPRAQHVSSRTAPGRRP